MDSLLKSDIFFVVATVATLVLSTLLAIALAYAIRAFKLLSDSSKIIKAKVTTLGETVDGAHSFVRKMNVVELFRSLVSKRRKGTKK